MGVVKKSQGNRVWQITVEYTVMKYGVTHPFLVINMTKSAVDQKLQRKDMI